MIELSTLYQAILEDPEDDVPRLAYADRCEELGDTERSEFIRRSISRWHACRKTPKPPKGKCRLWAGKPASDLPDNVYFGWRRGFLAEFHLHSSLAKKQLEDLVQAYPLEYVHFPNLEPTSNRDETEFYYRRTLDRLTYYGMDRDWFELLEPKEIRDERYYLQRIVTNVAVYDSKEKAKLDLSRAVLTWARNEVKRKSRV